MGEVLAAMVKAHEIQGVLALDHSFNRVGLDHVLLVRVASAAVATRPPGRHARAGPRRAFAGVDRRLGPADLPPRAQHRLPQVLGGGRRDQPGGAAGADLDDRRDGLSVRAHGAHLGLPGRVLPRPAPGPRPAARQLRDGEGALQDLLSGRVPRPDGGRGGRPAPSGGPRAAGGHRAGSKSPPTNRRSASSTSRAPCTIRPIATIACST